MKKYSLGEEIFTLKEEKKFGFQVAETQKEKTIKLLKENNIPFNVIYN